MYQLFVCAVSLISFCATLNARSKPAYTSVRQPRLMQPKTVAAVRYHAHRYPLLSYSCNNLFAPLLSARDPRAQVFPQEQDVDAHSINSGNTVIMHPHITPLDNNQEQQSALSSQHTSITSGAWRVLFTRHL